MKETKLLLGDNMVTLKTLADNSVDSVVTDPPYALTSIKKRFGKEGSAPAQFGNDGAFKRLSGGFMGKLWDSDVPSVELWQEVYRVLKPGGHILSFGGTRTAHRMIVNIEYAGFEIRDTISWIYSTGFPKSLNIGKAVDKIEGNDREILGSYIGPDGKERKGIERGFFNENELDNNIRIITKGSSKYEGWGTSLKPAQELICLARKPISEKTIAQNILKWGTGGINIDGSRIGDYNEYRKNHINTENETSFLSSSQRIYTNAEGRFPANIIFDTEAAKVLDEQQPNSSRYFKNIEVENYDSFFYCAKASTKERNEGVEDLKSTHPTIKPIKLMSYLCKLITPEDGVILDPFMGSGSTGVAAINENFNFVGCEMDSEYMKIAEARINHAKNN